MRTRCREILPRVTRILLREASRSMQLLGELDVPLENVTFTGDDAVETAFRLRPSDPGEALGVNVRIAGSAGTDGSLVDELRSAVSALRQALSCETVPAPIEIHTDTAAISRVLDSESPVPADETDVIRAIGRCRVLISGAYHAAVFALSQGVPVVAVAKTPYFRDKFLGLADQFPGGCRVLDATGTDLARRVSDAVESLWASAPAIRPALLAEAARQVELGKTAYTGLARLAWVE
jgi:colanic acid/amylovoran biosynthesis protein